MAEYDQVTAKHYAAWRPPLHEQILAEAIAPHEYFEQGIDVGCGTGQSTFALAKYCQVVTGIDPSQEMLSLTEESERVRFRPQKTSVFELDGVYDIFTFAGSLHYQNPEEVLSAVAKVSAPKATIVVYDFNVLLGPVFDIFRAQPEMGSYDHAKNFGRDTRFGLQEVKQVRGKRSFRARAGQIAHLLLSVQDWRTGVLAGKQHREISEILRERMGEDIGLEADIYLTRYGI